MKRIASVLSTLFLFASAVLYGQHYNLLNFNSNQGLSGITINDILKDHNNYMWLASEEGGICRFNGKNFTNYSVADGLKSVDTRSLCEDNNGNIWVATGAGLSIFNGKKFTTVKPCGLDTIDVRSIRKDKKNNLWISTLGNGLIKFDGKKYTRFTTQNGLPTNDILCSMEDNVGNIWIGTLRNGLCKISYVSTFKNRLNLLQYREEISGSGSVFSLLQDKNGTIWIGTTNAFVYRFKNKKLTPFKINEKISSSFVSKIIEDNTGAIWIATQENGLIKWQNEKATFYGKKEGFPSQEAYSLGIDNEKNLWVGTGGQGVCVFKNEAFLNFTEKDGLPNKDVTAFCELSNHTVLIGTQAGICSYNGTKINVLNKALNISDQPIFCIKEANDNTVWVGTENGLMLLSYANNEFRLLKKIESVQHVSLGSVFGIEFTDKATAWVVTSSDGLFKLEKNDSIHYAAPDYLLANDLYTLHKDNTNAIWISNTKSGVSKFDGKRFLHYNKNTELADKTIECIANNKQTIFFGTAENGLYALRNKQISKINFENEKTTAVINSILINPRYPDQIWIGTLDGLKKIVFEPNSLKVKSIKNYNENNGLTGNIQNENAILLDSRNNIWVGGLEGFSIFNPDLEKMNLIPPTIVIRDIRLFYQKVDWSNYSYQVNEKTGLPLELNLSYTNNHLTFDFQAISVDKGIKYTYKLEGFEKNWSPLSSATEAIYSNIPSGREYIFKVKAQNSDGVWSKKSASFRFSIASPIWQRKWFIVMSVFVLIGAVFLFINYRTKKLAREKKLLEDTVTERTIELKVTNEQLVDAFQDIKDSINYAQKIQQSILPVESKIKAAFPDSFVFLKPRDIVSGDFYWFASVISEGVLYHIIAAADCTGHGVPGAFMSMAGNTILNEIVITKHIVQPSEILSLLHQGIRTSLQQSENESRDGMDICLCSINSITGELHYAGAYNPLWILRKNSEIEVIKGTKAAIGGFTPDNQLFEAHTIHLQKGEAIYLFTDGYADQFGGAYGKKLTTKKFRDAIAVNAHQTMQAQGIYLDNFIESWKGNENQVDDILVIGIKL